MSIMNIIVFCIMCLMITSTQPMMMILTIIMLITTSAYYLVMIKANWTSLIIILSLIGGMLVLYTLICSQLSNESSKSPLFMNKFMMAIPLSLMMFYFNTQSTKDYKTLMFNLNWFMIMLVTMMVFCVTYTSSKMIYNPSKSMKSLM